MLRPKPIANIEIRPSPLVANDERAAAALAAALVESIRADARRHDVSGCFRDRLG